MRNKVKKPIYKRTWFILLMVLLVLGVLGSSCDSGSEDATSATKESEEISNIKAMDKSKLTNDFEKKLYDAVAENDGIVTDVYIDEETENIEFACENKETTVKVILNQLVEAQKENGSVAVCACINDMNAPEEEQKDYIVIADIATDGTLQMTFESPKYNSKRNLWIHNQFSAWDGSNKEMTEAIKDYLNDEKSYDHIETTYRDIRTQETADEINQTLSSSGYVDQVEIGDLFIITKFSAKNAFDATIKATAYGICSPDENYENSYVKLVAVE